MSSPLFSRRLMAASLVASMMLVASAVLAQDQSSPPASATVGVPVTFVPPPTLAAPATLASVGVNLPATQPDVPAQGSWSAQAFRDSNRQRPAALKPLYVSYAALQALDIHSTLSAIHQGGREVNPLFAKVTESPAGVIAVKAGLAAATIVLIEKTWKHHRTAAVLSMIAFNGAYTAIVARNYWIANNQRALR